MMTASVAPGKTTRARIRAVTAPVTREPAIYAGHRPESGGLEGYAVGVVLAGGRVRVSTFMAISLFAVVVVGYC